MEQEQQEQPKYRVVPVHTPSFTQALAVAMERDVLVWREVETGTPYSLKELFEFAQRQDKEHPLTGHQYYYVTTEGAIGISPGLEWLTTWMFVPMEDCQERDFMLLKMREDLQAEHAAREAVEQAVTEGLAKEKAAKAAPAPKPAPKPVSAPKPKPAPVPAGGGSPVSKPAEAPKPEPPAPALNFCPNCGARVVPGNKFCTQCGHRFM